MAKKTGMDRQGGAMKRLVGLILGVALLVGGGAAQALDEVSLKKFKTLNVCEGCDLSGA